MFKVFYCSFFDDYFILHNPKSSRCNSGVSSMDLLFSALLIFATNSGSYSVSFSSTTAFSLWARDLNKSKSNLFCVCIVIVFIALELYENYIGYKYTNYWVLSENTIWLVFDQYSAPYAQVFRTTLVCTIDRNIEVESFVQSFQLCLHQQSGGWHLGQ